MRVCSKIKNRVLPSGGKPNREDLLDRSKGESNFCSMINLMANMK